MSSPFRTVKESAAWLRLSDCQVRELVRHGKIPARKHGGKVLILFTDLEAYSNAANYPVKKITLTRFQAVRERLRSLKTEHTESLPSSLQKGA